MLWYESNANRFPQEQESTSTRMFPVRDISQNIARKRELRLVRHVLSQADYFTDRSVLTWFQLHHLARKTSEFIIYQKFPFSCVLLVESVSREIDEMRLPPSQQRARETMHYSPVNNKKNHVRHHGNTRPLDSRKPRMFCEWHCVQH